MPTAILLILSSTSLPPFPELEFQTPEAGCSSASIGSIYLNSPYSENDVVESITFSMVMLKSIKDRQSLLITFILVVNETNLYFLTHQFL